MNRVAFVLHIQPNQKDAFVAATKVIRTDIAEELGKLSTMNFSAWSICDFVFCYGETSTTDQQVADAVDALVAKLNGTCTVLAKPGTMRLMYHDIGVVRTDKSLIRHRVFATHIKPNCADEYKARHDKLIKARFGAVSDGPETNFTIWCAKDEFNFGYCELVKSYDHELTAEERQATIDWETYQLGIMDWYTDDVDWITGEKHEPARLIYQYN